MWLAGVGRVLSAMLQASWTVKELRYGESSIPVSYSKQRVRKKMGTLSFQYLNWRAKKGKKKKKKELTTFLIYVRSNGREDLTSHNTFGIVFITEITLLIASTN